ncbi:MAG: phosphatidylcholine/phosphatidylserine synthase [Myxococcota bacterium]|nr:phosphatidylcholine/phosphatidylserine synthase [Myxococcota bacterium]
MREKLPSVITLLGLCCGFIALVMASTSPQVVAPLAIIGAALCDMLDGRLARKFGVTSDFGKELDSLTDIVSFGAAPALVAFHFARDELGFGPVWPMVATIIFVMCTAIRLARFNLDTSVRPGFFAGIPSPTAAMCVVTWIMASGETGLSVFGSGEAYCLYVLFLAGGMISSILLPSFKSFKTQLGQIMFFGSILSGFVLLGLGGPGGTTLFTILNLYILWGLLRGGQANATIHSPVSS